MPQIIINNNQNGGTVCCKDPAALNYFYGSCDNVCLDNSCCVYTQTQANAPTTQITSPTFSFDTIAGVIDSIPQLLPQKPKGQQSNPSVLRTCFSGVTCVNCSTTNITNPSATTSSFVSLNWWNNFYIQNHNGVSLQTSDPILWQNLVSTVINSGETFYVYTDNGDVVDNEICCRAVNGLFRDGICHCVGTEGENYTPKCLETLNDVLDLISTPEGFTFFQNNFNNIGSSLGLTQQQINFIKSVDSNGVSILNSTSQQDTNNNGIVDSTEARLLLVNALNRTGGFYVHFGNITNKPVITPETSCIAPRGENLIQTQRTGFFIAPGYWNTVSNTCMCKPIVNQCTIDLSQVSTISTKDFYNTTINIVVYNGTTNPIGEACCNRLVADNPSLPWVWQDQPNPACYTVPKEDCLPVLFSMNNETMVIPPCQNNLELSMWVYFKSPERPCDAIPKPPDDDIIFLDGQFCDVTLTPNTGAIVPSNPNPTLPNSPSTPTPTPVTTKCCYNNNNPILARIYIDNLNQDLTPIKIYNSSLDYFDRWVQIKSSLPTFGLTTNFKVSLEIYQGLSCCCDYEIYIDDIRVDCSTTGPGILVSNTKSPGFNLTRVIDNKKSWVYNPGNPLVGTSSFDTIEREDGSFGMLNGEGSVNRTFAPSLDAELPWRYTNYYEQSGVYENHSNLVINSKELWLTYDMCAKCPISGMTLTCPEGYILSANTQICYSGNT